MQESTIVTTMPPRATSQSRQAVVLAARLGAALLAGSLVVVGPWAADVMVGRALAVRASRILAARTGLSVRIGRIRPLGLLSAGLVAEDVQLVDPDLSVTAKRVVMTRTLSGTRISVIAPLLVGSRKGLARLVRRIPAPNGGHGPAGSGTLQSLLGHSSINVLDGSAWIRIGMEPARPLRLVVTGFRLDRAGPGGSFRATLVARLASHDLAATVQLEHITVHPNKLVSWLHRGRKWASRDIGTVLRASPPPALDWLDDAKGLVAIHVTPAGSRRYLACTGSCRWTGFVGSFKVETLAKGLTNARIAFTDTDGVARIKVQATRDRIADKWRIDATFGDLPARLAGHLLPGIHVTQGRIDGKAAVRARRDLLQGRLALRFDGNLFLHNRLLSERPSTWRGVGLDLRLSIRHDRSGWTSRIGKATIEHKNVRLGLQGQIMLRPDRAWKADLTARLASTPCQNLLNTLPHSLVPVLSGMKLDGKLGGRLHFKADSRNLEDLVAHLQTTGRCRVAQDAPAADPHRLLRDAVVLKIRDADGQAATMVLGPTNPAYRPLPRLPAHLVRAFLITEDRRFFSHKGFDWEQIRRALAMDIQKKAVIKGASSISQQVVKNLYLNQRRTLSRKLQEAILTWRMEQVVPKRRILELYLNLVEMGPGLYGVAQGARAYFGKPARLLTPIESMHLASITPAPRRYYRLFKSKGRVGMAWLAKLRHRLRWMERYGWISKPDYEKLSKRELFLAAF